MGRGENLGELEAMVMAAVLRAQPSTGPAVYRELEERTGRDPSLPAIHVTLRRLSAKGLLAAELAEPSPHGGRRPRAYRLTAEGAEALSRFRSVWDALLGDLEITGTGDGSPTRQSHGAARSTATVGRRRAWVSTRSTSTATVAPRSW